MTEQQCKYCKKKLKDFIEIKLGECFKCASKETEKRYKEYKREREKERKEYDKAI